jgi:chemotaxis protein histidine kinase CheA
LTKSEFYFDDIIVQYRSEFIESITERLNSSDDLIRDMIKDKNCGASLTQFLLHIHSIKGQGGTFGFGTVTTIAQKLEDYVEAVTKKSHKQMNDIQCFVDSIRRIIENGVDPDEAEQKIIFEALPVSTKNINYVDSFY